MANSVSAPASGSNDRDGPTFTLLASTLMIFGAIAGTSAVIIGSMRDNVQIVWIGAGLIGSVIMTSICGRWISLSSARHAIETHYQKKLPTTSEDKPTSLRKPAKNEQMT